jgi:hypothetical protein
VKTTNLNYARVGHSSNLVALNGNDYVLVTGGVESCNGDAISKCELILVPKDTGKPTTTNHEIIQLHESRGYHTASKLRNGNILITGGTQKEDSFSCSALSSCELFNTAAGHKTTKEFAKVPPMVYPRHRHAAIVLQDGLYYSIYILLLIFFFLVYSF